MESKSIALLIVALLIGVGAGAGVGYVAFHNNGSGDNSGDATYFYIYDNQEYTDYHQTHHAASYTGATITKLYTESAGTYSEYAGNPYTGENLNNTYYFLQGTTYIPVLLISYQDPVTYSYSAFTESTWDGWGESAKKKVVDYVDPVAFKESANSVVKGVWVKGYGSTLKESFANACERIGYEMTMGGYGISSLNGIDDGNFCLLFYVDNAWDSTHTWDDNNVSKYVAVGHGVWDSAMFSPPLPGITVPENIPAI